MGLGAVKPWVAASAGEITRRFGITNIGGYRSSGSVPNSDHPRGLADDVMIKSKGQGDAVAAYSVANADRLGITYVIWDRKIWNPSVSNQWRDYDGPSAHTDHVHRSYRADGPRKGGRMSTTDAVLTGAEAAGGIGGGLAAAARALLGIQDQAQQIADVGLTISKLALPTTQVRIWSGVLGAVLLIIGITVLAREAVKS